jgi:hypothetical protein
MLSLKATPHKVMGGPGFSIECDVFYKNTGTQPQVISISNADFYVHGPRGLQLDHQKGSGPPDASRLEPGQERLLSFSFHSSSDSACSVSVTLAGQGASAHL